MASTNTNKLGLLKPTPGTEEPVNVQTQLNDNWDKIDAGIGAPGYTSASLPASPYAGQIIQETDTNRIKVRNTLPGVSGSWNQVMSQNAIFSVSGTAGTATVRQYLAGGAASANRALAYRGAGDTQDHFTIDYDGKVQWGSGSAVVDTNLYRSAPNTLKTDDSLIVAGSLTVTGAVSSGGDISTTGNLGVTGTIDGHGIVYTLTYSGTTDSQGLLVITHGLGFTPVGGWAITTNATISFAAVWGIDSIGSTSVRVRFQNVAGTGALASTAVQGRLFLIK